MLQALATIQKVELVGAESWWSNNVGSLLIAVAAFFAAALAAYVAIRTHQGQLDHDRRERNRDHMREVLDAAAKVSGRTRQAVIRYQAAIGVVEQALQKEESVEQGRSLCVEEQGRAISEVQAMHTELTRLEMRLGREHGISSAYREALTALNEVMRKVHIPDSADDFEKREQETSRRDEAVDKAFKKYLAASYAWFDE